jgi:hypothetical protein
MPVFCSAQPHRPDKVLARLFELFSVIPKGDDQKPQTKKAHP